jgi:hypothetical protein
MHQRVRRGEESSYHDDYSYSREAVEEYAFCATMIKRKR